MPIIGIQASSTRQGLATSSFYSLDTYLVTTPQASITFSNIDQTFKHLFVHVSGRCGSDGNADFQICVNGATSSWNEIQMYLSNGSFSAGATSNVRRAPALGNFLSATGNVSGLGTSVAYVNIADYSAAKYHHVQMYGGQYNGSANNAQMTSGFNTADANPVTSIRFEAEAQSRTFGTGTRISLYGLKG